MLCWSVLLLGVLLLTAAAQDSEEQQKENQELYSLSSEGEGPPEHVTVLGASESSLLVSWEPPASQPDYYIVDIFTEDISEVVYSSSYVVDGLQTCTSYYVTVTSYYKDGEFPSQLIQGTTKSPVPQPPQDCTISEPETGKVQVQWKDQVSECRITNHSIVWTWDVLWSDEEGSDETFTTSSKYTLSDVTPYTNVTAEIRSGTDGGFSTPIYCWLATSQDTPGAPVIVNTTSQEEGSVTLTWTPPLQANGIILKYRITSKTEEGSSSITVDGTVLTAVLEDLNACQTYNFSVAAATVIGWGPESNESSVTIPGNIPPPQDCKISEPEKGKVQVQWKDPDVMCRITNHSIIWTWDVLWSDEEGSVETFTTSTQNTLSDVTFYTNVTAEIRAGTDGGFSAPLYCWVVTSPDTRITVDNSNMLCWSVLLLGVLLLTAAAQDSEEQQKENQELYSLSSEGEGPPEHVTVLGASESSLIVSWEPPASQPDYYIVEIFTEDISEVVYSSSYVVDGLQTCTSYYVTVTSYYKDGEFPSQLIQGTTKSPVPQPPQDCTISEPETGKVQVQWKDQVSECRITNHSIVWTWDVLWSDEEGSDETFTTSSKYTLSDVTPYTNVTAEIRSGTDGGFSTPIYCWLATSQDTPGAPVIVNTTSQEEGSVTLTWTPPLQANGIILKYRITSKSEEGSSPITVDGTVLTAVLEDLNACQTYNFSVAAATVIGWGPESNESSVTITGNITLSESNCSIEESNVKVCWSANFPQCPVPYYTVTWNGTVKWSDQPVFESDIYLWSGHPENCYVVNDSVPYTDYTLCVNVVDLTSQTLCCSSETPQSVPGPPVLENLEVKETSITVTWNEPVDKNGIIGGYLVTWSSNEGDTNNQSVGSDSRTYVIPDLQPCSTYSVTVQASTGAGRGEQSSPQNATIANYQSGVNCTSDTRQVEVTWSVASPECPVSGLFLAWNTSVLWSSNTSSNSTELDGNVNSVVVSELPPYTEVFACLSIPDGDYSSICCTCVSDEEVPGPPVLENLEVKETSITVTWNEPVDKNGIIGGYLVTWSSNEGDTNNQSVGSDSRTYVIQDLQPCSTYSVTVQASTGAGRGEQSSPQNATIANYIPESGLSCINESRQVEVTWSAASPECPVSGFFLAWNTKVLWSSNTSSNSTELDGNVNSVVVSELPPYTEVFACLSIPDGDYSSICCTCVSDEEVPGPPVLENLEVKETSITVTWNEPVDKNGIIGGYLVTWSSNEGDTNNQSVESDSRTYVIQDLQPCYTYSVTVQASTGAGRGEQSSPQSVAIANYISEHGLNCTSDGTRQIDVSWSLASLECPVSTFLLAWHTTVLWSGSTSSNSTTLDGTATRVVFTDLQPYTQVYTILTIMDDQGGSFKCTSTTEQDVPGPPVLENLEVKETSITVTWNEPVDKNGIIGGYLVTWSSNEGDTNNQSVGSDSRTYVIQDLQPCYTYSVTVQASTGAGRGEQSSPQNATIANYIAESDLHCNNEETRQVEVTWSVASPECPVSGLLLAWNTSVLWSGNTSSNTTTLDGEDTSVILPDLLPYTEVVACITITDNTGVSFCCSTITQQETPGAPVITKITALGSSATLTWTPPQEANGVIQEYRITSKGQDGSNNIVDGIDGSLLTAVVDGLDTCETYNFTVTASTDAGWGDPSDDKSTFITANSTLSNAQCTAEQSKVKLCWDTDPPQCPASYTVTWNGTVKWSDQPASGSEIFTLAGNSDKCYMVNDSVPYTAYTVCVDVEDLTSAPSCCSMETPQSTPGPPDIENLKAIHTSITVEWSEPVKKNGILDKYLVLWDSDLNKTEQQPVGSAFLSYEIEDLLPCTTYSVSVKAHTGAGWGVESQSEAASIANYIPECDLNYVIEARQVEVTWSLASPHCSVSGLLLAWNTSVLWSGNTSFDTKALDADTTLFSIDHIEADSEVVACVSTANDQSSVTCCTTTTAEEAPSPPMDLQSVRETHNSISLNWSLPRRLNGQLKSWVLNVSDYDTSDLQFDLDPSDLQYTIDNLQSSTLYTIQLTAVNNAGSSIPAEILAGTSTVSSHVGAIVGGSVGGLLLLIVVAGGVYFTYRRKRRSENPAFRKYRGNATPTNAIPMDPQVPDENQDEYKHQQKSYKEQRYWLKN